MKNAVKTRAAGVVCSILFAAAGILSGTSVHGASLSANENKASAGLLFNIITGEIALHRKDYRSAYDALARSSLQSMNAELARESWQAAAALNSKDLIAISSRNWTRIEPGAVVPRFSLMSLALEAKDADALKKLFTDADEDFAELGDSKGKWLSDLFELYSIGRIPNAPLLIETASAYVKRYSSNPDLQLGYAAVLKNSGRSLLACRTAIDASRLPSATSLNAASAADLCWSVNTKATQELVFDFLKRHPDDASTRLVYARILARSGNLDSAKKELDSVLASKNKDSMVLFNAGQVALEVQEYAAAEKILLEFILKSQKDEVDLSGHKAWLLLGDAASQQKAFERAAQYYLKLSDGPSAAGARIKAAVSFSELGNIDAVDRTLSEARELFPDKASAFYSAQAEIHRLSGDLEGAAALLDEAVEALPSPEADILFEAAMLHQASGRSDSAEKLLRRALEQNPRHVQANNALGYLIVESDGNLNEARRLLETAYSLAPLDPFILDSMGWLAYKEGKLKTAREFIQTSLRSMYDEEVAEHLFIVLEALGAYTEFDALASELEAKHKLSEDLRRVVEELRNDRR